MQVFLENTVPLEYAYRKSYYFFLIKSYVMFVVDILILGRLPNKIIGYLN